MGCALLQKVLMKSSPSMIFANIRLKAQFGSLDIGILSAGTNWKEYSRFSLKDHCSQGHY